MRAIWRIQNAPCAMCEKCGYENVLDLIATDSNRLTLVARASGYAQLTERTHIYNIHIHSGYSLPR